ncbi:SDR family oxidoreductase [Fibrella aquatica]|uniref:SDR family oxidoreductase n=1 Tax=Fibrella aquatica TaxID=3242487 RepID=UPI003522C902
MTIAIIGATGMLGQPVTRELLSAGYTVRIVARNLTAAKRLFPAADVVFGDLRKPDSLPAALAGCEAMYLSLSVKQTEKSIDFHTESDGLRTLLAAAKVAGVKRIAYLSSIVMRYQGMNGFDWWVFRIKQEAVSLIKVSGLDYSIFYPSNFMETMLTTQRVGPLVLVLGSSKVKPWFISAQDYGKQVARALQIAQVGQPQEYVIQGPEPVNQLVAAKRLAANYTNSKLRVMEMPLAMLRLGRLFSQQADYGVHIAEALNNYPEQFEAERTWLDLGKPYISIDRFATGVGQGG